MAYALDDPTTAASVLAELDTVALGGEERDRLAAAPAAVAELRRDADVPPS